MAKEFSFPPQNRLKKRLHFQLVFEEGKKVESETLSIWYLKNLDYYKTEKEPQNFKKIKAGIIVSHKLGKAVKRNRIKRLIREAVRLSANKIKDGIWFIVCPKTNIESLNQAMEELNKIFAKAGILK